MCVHVTVCANLRYNLLSVLFIFSTRPWQDELHRFCNRMTQELQCAQQRKHLLAKSPGLTQCVCFWQRITMLAIIMNLHLFLMWEGGSRETEIQKAWIICWEFPRVKAVKCVLTQGSLALWWTDPMPLLQPICNVTGHAWTDGLSDSPGSRSLFPWSFWPGRKRPKICANWAYCKLFNTVISIHFQVFEVF